MEIQEQKAVVEAILFAAGKEVEITTFMSALELPQKDVELLLSQMQTEYVEQSVELRLYI